MKKLVGVEIGRYTFEAKQRRVSFWGVDLSLSQILLIINQGTILYSFSDPSLSGSLVGNVLTLAYNTTNMKDTDPLLIYVDVPETAISTEDAIGELVDERDERDNASKICAYELDLQPTLAVPVIYGQTPAAIATPVSIANEQFFDLAKGPSVTYGAPVGAILERQDCLQYRQVALEVLTGASVAAGVIVFEQSNTLDATAWAACPLLDMATTSPLAVSTTPALTASSKKVFAGPVTARYFRARVSTAVTAARMVQVTAVYRMTPFAYPLTTVAQTANVTQFGTTNVVTAGVSGMLAAGGNIAPGTVATANPLTTGGVDSSGKVRRNATDFSGNRSVCGPDPGRAGAPVKVSLTESTLSKLDLSETQELIIRLLHMIALNIRELPLYMNMRPDLLRIHDEVQHMMEDTDELIDNRH